MLETRLKEYILDYNLTLAKPRRRESLATKKSSNILGFNAFGGKNVKKKEEIKQPETCFKPIKVILFPKKLQFCEEYLIKHDLLKNCHIYEANIDLVFMNTDIISLEYRKLFTDYYLVRMILYFTVKK